jgi:hypothetical protein
MLGSDEEAIICVENVGSAWAERPETALWLVDQLPAGKPAKRQTRKPQ